MSDEPMKDKEQVKEIEVSGRAKAKNRWPRAAAFVFFCAMVAGIIYALHERAQAERLASDYSQMSATLNEAQSQLASLTAKLNDLAATQESKRALEPTPVASEAQVKGHPHTAARATRRRTDDPRWKQVQSELAEHQKQIETARQDLEKTRTDLDSKLSSTRDELNGSIARNHDELVVLQKRGERNFYEFDLVKSKQFQRVGPVSLALRKANTKQLFCDLKLIVDDKELTKKHVSLYEPVQFYPVDYGQPLEIVIYQINKDEAHGYVSAPKYRPSELAATPAPESAATADAQPAPTDSEAAGLDHRPEPLQ